MPEFIMPEPAAILRVVVMCGFYAFCHWLMKEDK